MCLFKIILMWHSDIYDHIFSQWIIFYIKCLKLLYIYIYILLNILCTDSNTAIHIEHFFTKYKRKKRGYTWQYVLLSIQLTIIFTLIV